MHLGQIGFWQMEHCPVARSRCRAQFLEDAEGAGGGAAGGASSDTRNRAAAGGGGGGGGGAADATDAPGSGGVGVPNSRRMRSLTKSDESNPQLGQMNFTGCVSISGVASKAYFAPQEHCSFMLRQGLGFNNTIPGAPASEKASCAGLNSTLPSPNRKFPPNL